MWRKCDADVRLCPQIQEGMVVYVCCFHGATEDVAHEMGSMCFPLQVSCKLMLTCDLVCFALIFMDFS